MGGLRPPTDAEWHALQEGMRSHHATTVLRSQILLASVRGEHPEHIAAALGCQPEMVHALIDTYTSDGLTAPREQDQHLRTNATSAAWLAWSGMGIAWSVLHLGLERLMGAGSFHVALVAALLIWTMTLVCAASGRRRALYLAIALGALCCYDMSIQHYSMLGPVDRLRVFMWQARPEGASAAWALPYNLLVYAGTLIGLAILWTSARVANTAGDRVAVKLALGIAGLLACTGLGVTMLPNGPQGDVQIARALYGALIALVIMLAAARYPQRRKHSPSSPRARRQA